MKITYQYSLSKQGGAALFVGLIMLVVLMIIGVAAVRNSTFQEKMAANVHQTNWIFNTAESGASAFNILANTGQDTDPDHILFRTRQNGSTSFCLDQGGNEAPCGSSYLDNQVAEVTVTAVNRGCVQRMCFGYSLGVPGETVKCLVYEIDSVSTGNNLTDSVEWWAFQLTIQC